MSKHNDFQFSNCAYLHCLRMIGYEMTMPQPGSCLIDLPIILLRVAAFNVIGVYKVRIGGTNASSARAITSDKYTVDTCSSCSRSDIQIFHRERWRRGHVHIGA
jgi:hypothetical protein